MQWQLFPLFQNTLTSFQVWSCFKCCYCYYYYYQVLFLLLVVVVVVVVVVLLCFLTWHCTTAVFRMYRGLLGPVVLVALLGINVYIWAKHNINYTFIFGLNPRSVVCVSVCVVCVCVCVCVCVYVYVCMCMCVCNRLHEIFLHFRSTIKHNELFAAAGLFALGWCTSVLLYVFQRDAETIPSPYSMLIQYISCEGVGG